MSTKIGASVVAGVIGGVVFGMMMHMMTAPTPDGAQMPVRIKAEREVIHVVG